MKQQVEEVQITITIDSDGIRIKNGTTSCSYGFYDKNKRELRKHCSESFRDFLWEYIFSKYEIVEEI